MKTLKIIMVNAIGTILGIHITSSICIAYFLLNMKLNISSWVILQKSIFGLFTILDMYAEIGNRMYGSL